MSVDSTQSSGTTPPATVVEPAGNRANQLGSQAFLQLLVTQLQNQDPTSPQSNTEFIAQLAQFSSLEQLTAINKAVTSMAKVFGDAGATTNSADKASA